LIDQAYIMWSSFEKIGSKSAEKAGWEKEKLI